MPPDFPLHKDEMFKELKYRYQVGTSVIQRWKRETGARRIHGRPIIRIAPDGTREVFPSVTVAASFFPHGSIGNLSRAAHMGCTAYGYHWTYEEAERDHIF